MIIYHALSPIHDSPDFGVLFGNGDGTFATGSAFVVDASTKSQSPQTPTSMAIADFNGDGKPDIATANTNAQTITVALGTGGGMFKPPATISLGSVQPISIAAGAFSSDGKPDLVVTDGQAHIYFLNHNGDGTFQQPASFPTSGTNANYVVTGDFNGDKKLDVAVVNSGSNNVSILTGTGSGGFNPATTVTVGPTPIGAVAGDFNGDGKLDLAVAYQATLGTTTNALGGVSVLLGNGDGTFQPAVNYAAYDYPVFISAADVNGDGNIDLVVASKSAAGQSEIAVLAGTGKGTFQNAVLTAASSNPTSVTVADFNGDGKPDLVVAHCCNFTPLAFMQGNGDGTFQAESQFALGSFFATATADFNGDGKADLAFADYFNAFGRIVAVCRNLSVSQGSLTITNGAGNPLKAPPIAVYSIATAKGSDLATGTLANTATDPPTTILGTTVAVTDSAGASRPAQLFYVSNGQVNFLIPQGTAVGNATVAITSGDGHVSVGTVAVTAVAPGIFTLNSNSLVAAYLQIVHADGTQSIEFLYAVDASGNVTFPPISLGPSTDQVYLNIFATGIQGRSSLSAVAVTVGGVATTPLYAAASTYPGEDQVVILLPRSLVGAGTVNITLSADGLAANTTTLQIQ